ncbi:unnamed protein product, partial [Nesidiocoris tenuis]
NQSDVPLRLLQSIVPPQLVTWHHNDKIIYYKDATASKEVSSAAPEDENGRRAHIVTDTDASDKTHSRLLITDATTADSGNYTCQASHTEPDSVYVFVSSGKEKKYIDERIEKKN